MGHVQVMQYWSGFEVEIELDGVDARFSVKCGPITKARRLASKVAKLHGFKKERMFTMSKYGYSTKGVG